MNFALHRFLRIVRPPSSVRSFKSTSIVRDETSAALNKPPTAAEPTSPVNEQELYNLLDSTQNEIQYSSQQKRAWKPDQLRKIVHHKVIQPSSFTMKRRTQTRQFFKYPYLGPTASESRRNDVFHQLEIDPLHECFNSRLLSNFITELGRIKGRAETNLTWRSQRRLTKAIKRAKMIGIIPLYSRRHTLWNP